MWNVGFLLFYIIFKELFSLLFLGLKIGWFFIRHFWPAMMFWLLYMFILSDVYIFRHRIDALGKKVTVRYVGMVFLYCVLAQFALLGWRKLNRKYHITGKSLKLIKKVF